MLFEPQQRRWRWAAFATTVLNIAFNFVSQRASFGVGGIPDVVQRHPALFSPAPYAFAIWGLIYFATLAYAIHQLLPSQRHVDAFDRMAKPLIALNALATAWLVVFRFDLVTCSVLVIVVSLLVSMLFFRDADAAVSRGEARKWILLAATLWFAWLTVATLANISLWLVAMGWVDARQVQWAVAALAIAVALGFGVGSRYGNWAYPAVIAWASAAIWVERRQDAPIVAALALLSAALLVAWAVYCAIQARPEKRGFRIFHGPIDAG